MPSKSCLTACVRPCMRACAPYTMQGVTRRFQLRRAARPPTKCSVAALAYRFRYNIKKRGRGGGRARRKKVAMVSQWVKIAGCIFDFMQCVHSLGVVAQMVERPLSNCCERLQSAGGRGIDALRLHFSQGLYATFLLDSVPKRT